MHLGLALALRPHLCLAVEDGKDALKAVQSINQCAAVDQAGVHPHGKDIVLRQGYKGGVKGALLEGLGGGQDLGPGQGSPPEIQ
jgi:hypothetical protein